jgi:hypothetical protein
MAIYNNNYYPDSRNSTWADIADLTWADATYDWSAFSPTSSNATATWSYTTDAQDLGSQKTFYPTTEITWDSSKPITITYDYSQDGTTYYNTQPGSITARYIKTNVSTAGSYVGSIFTQINYNPTSETHYNLNTATLAGNVNYRTLDTNNFSSIQSVSVTPAVSETRPVAGRLIANNTGNIQLRIVNLDTWDKVAVDANVNIVVTGFPFLTTNANAGIVAVTK